MGPQWNCAGHWLIGPLSSSPVDKRQVPQIAPLRKRGTLPASTHLRPGRRKDEDENQFKGFPRKGSTQCQPPEVADECGARLQVEGALSQTLGRSCCSAQLAA